MMMNTDRRLGERAGSGTDCTSAWNCESSAPTSPSFLCSSGVLVLVSVIYLFPSPLSDWFVYFSSFSWGKVAYQPCGLLTCSYF